MAAEEAYFLAIDVGTGSIRAAIVGESGGTLGFSQKEHETFIPQPGWVEQDPETWWAGVKATVREVLDKTRLDSREVKAVSACGQMHGPVPIDAEGNVLLSRVQLWNDKRSEAVCRKFREAADEAALLQTTANPIAPSWIGFKVAWMKAHQAEAYRNARAFLVPKDFINFKLTGKIATDYSEASGSYLLDWRTLEYSTEVASLLGLDVGKFAPLGPSDEIIGEVTAKAARETGLAEGTPVVAGGGDFLVSLLGSGITRPGIGSDVTGTSTLISVWSEEPLLDNRVMNLHAAGEGWVPFTLIDAGGECMRWARRTFAPGDAPFDDINRAAAEVAPGSEGLVFLPYLTGERIGGRADSRAQFSGIAIGHTPAHFYRAVMEGSAFASKRSIEIMRRLGSGFNEIVATAGGAKGRLWLAIKASVYNLPIRVPANVESGVLGCAILAGCAVGTFSSPRQGAERLVKMKTTIEPAPAWVKAYQKQESLFNRLYEEK